MQTQLSETRDFADLIAAKWAEGKFICMGLDPVYERIPLSVSGRFEGDDTELDEQAVAYYNFCVQIVDATHDLVAAYKPNTAFFEALGGVGYDMLRLLIRHIHRVAPDVAVIVDAKRADIGATNVGSAKLIFDILAADAVTVNPYFGEEALQPFLERSGKGVIVLCRTSNPGAGELQNLMIEPSQAELGALSLDPNWGAIPLYQYLALRLNLWQCKGTLAVVVGATAPDEAKEVRQLLPYHVFLMPGIGKQGGDLGSAVRSGITESRDGILVNAGSKELYASADPDFAQATRSGIIVLNQDVERLRLTA